MQLSGSLFSKKKKTGGVKMNSEQKMKLQRYYEENKVWLAKIALCGDPIVRSMALVVLKEGSMRREDEQR